MKIRIALLAVVLLALSATQGAAQEQESRWIPVSESERVTVSIDPERIRRSGKALQAWTRWEYGAAQTAANGRRYRRRLSLVAFDCGARRTRYLQSAMYDASGVVVMSFTRPQDEWSEVIPDSVSEAVLEEVCEYAESRSI